MAKTTVAALFCSTAAIGLLSAAPSFAQESSGANGASQTSPASGGAAPASPAATTGLQEVVITATRRSESLDKVPVSVAAFTQSTLDKQNVRTFQDVASLTPGVTFTPGHTGNTSSSSLTIRGIVPGSGTATVGVYIDDTPVQIRYDGYQSSNPYPQIFDLDRVEILRGPQGTLFGAGSEGGTVRFILPEPSLTRYSAYGRAGLSTTEGGDPSYELGAAVGGPIVEDKLGFRFSASYQRDGGYVDRVNWYTRQVEDPNSNWNDAKTLRLAIKWAPTDRLVVTPSLYYQDTYINDSSNYWEYFSNPSSGKFENANPLQTPTHDKFYLPALKLQYDLSGIRVISNSSFLDRTKQDVYDSTTLDMSSFAGIETPVPPASLAGAYAPGYLQDRQQVFTQEIRLQNTDPNARLNWTAGVFYQHTKQKEFYNVQDTFVNDFLTYSAGFPLTINDVFGLGLYKGQYLLYSNSALDNEEVAGYGQVDFAVTSKLKLTAGVRVAHETYTSTAFGAGPVESTDVGTTDVVHETDNPVTPKFGVSYQWDPADLYYFSAAKGYRQGSATDALGTRCAGDAAALGISDLGQRQIAPDTVWSYEVGAKNRLFGGKVQSEASFYRIDWQNIQTALTLPTCDIPTEINAGSAVSQGFDWQVSAVVAPGLQVGASVGYDDAHYTQTIKGSGSFVVVSSGDPLPVAPWTATFSAQYDFIAFELPSYARLDYQFASHDSTPLDLADYTTDSTIPRTPESNNLDLRFGMKFNGFDVSVFGSNITNQHPEVTRYRDNNTTDEVYRGQTVRPRTFGITGIYRY